MYCVTSRLFVDSSNLSLLMLYCYKVQSYRLSGCLPAPCAGQCRVCGWTVAEGGAFSSLVAPCCGAAHHRDCVQVGWEVTEIYLQCAITKHQHANTLLLVLCCLRKVNKHRKLANNVLLPAPKWIPAVNSPKTC